MKRFGGILVVLMLGILITGKIPVHAATMLYYVNDNTAIYTEKSTSSTVLINMTTGMMVLLDEQQGTWCKVTHGDYTGYMKTKYLQEEMPGFTGTIHGVDGNELSVTIANAGSASGNSNKESADTKDSATMKDSEESTEETVETTKESVEAEEKLKINQEFDEQMAIHESLVQEADKILQEESKETEESFFTEETEEILTPPEKAKKTNRFWMIAVGAVVAIAILTAVNLRSKENEK